jgi:hypothetical protein
MKNAFFIVSTITTIVFWFITLGGWLKKANEPKVIETIYDTVCVEEVFYDTIFTYTELSIPTQSAYSGPAFTEQDKIEFVKFVNTQQRICNEDQWAVIQVMLNICKAGGWTWFDYSHYHHHEGTFFDRCRSGLVWSYTYDPENPRDKEIMNRLNLALEGKIPEYLRIPDNMIAFESHRSPAWNAHVTSGLWQRSMIGLTLDHEFYYDWSKVTQAEREMWNNKLKTIEEVYKYHN